MGERGRVDGLVRTFMGGGLLSFVVPGVGVDGNAGASGGEAACPVILRWANGVPFVVLCFGMRGWLFMDGRQSSFYFFAWVYERVVRGVDGRRIVVYRGLRRGLGGTVGRYPRSGLFILTSRRAHRLYVPILSRFSYVGGTRFVCVKTRSIRGGLRALTCM